MTATTGLVTRPIVTQSGATTPDIANVTCTLANTEYSYALPTNCKGYMIQPRGQGSLKLAYTMGDSGLIFVTIYPNTFHAVGDILITSPVTLYFQSPTAGTIVEIETWV